jgi:hypothetical protein
MPVQEKDLIPLRLLANEYLPTADETKADGAPSDFAAQLGTMLMTSASKDPLIAQPESTGAATATSLAAVNSSLRDVSRQLEKRTNPYAPAGVAALVVAPTAITRRAPAGPGPAAKSDTREARAAVAETLSCSAAIPPQMGPYVTVPVPLDNCSPDSTSEGRCLTAPRSDRLETAAASTDPVAAAIGSTAENCDRVIETTCHSAADFGVRDSGRLSKAGQSPVAKTRPIQAQGQEEQTVLSSDSTTSRIFQKMQQQAAPGREIDVREPSRPASHALSGQSPKEQEREAIERVENGTRLGAHGMTTEPRTTDTPAERMAPAAPRASADPALDLPPARMATLRVDLSEGGTAKATIRERGGAVEVKIVTPTLDSARHLAGEVGALRRSLDNAGLRLRSAEIAYRNEGNERRQREDFRDGHEESQAAVAEVFTIKERNQ